MGLPGARLIDRGDGTNEFLATPNDATTPNDKALQSGLRLDMGVTWELSSAVELIIDAGARKKDQDSSIRDNNGGVFNQIVDTELTTWSLTPRGNIEWIAVGQHHHSTIGTDLYYA